MNNRFTRLFTLFDQIKNELLGTLSYAEDLEKRERLIEKGEQSLVARSGELDKQRQTLTAKEAEQARNKEYIDRENVRITKQAHQLEYDRNQLADVEKKQEIIDLRQQELTKHELALTEKIKSLEGLLAKEKELEEREAKLAREIAIDRERKRVLDLRVTRIKEREQQLQLDSEIADL